MQRRRRVQILAAVVLLAIAVLCVQALTAAEKQPLPQGESTAEAYPGYTLVSTQAYEGFRNDNGDVRLVAPDGETVWRYDPPHAFVFDAELTENGTVLVAMGESARAPGVECPEKYGGTPESGTPGPFRCIHNRVVEIDFETKNVVWEHGWYDAFPTHHEVHDADRLANGETAIVDMGNDRVFTVDRSGTVTWEWNARNHIGAGTEFWTDHVPEDTQDEFRRQGPESDWTHMNDVDRLDNGNFQVSIRNFDVVLEIDPDTNEIANVVGAPDNHTVMNEQHNPMWIEGGTVLIADSSHGGPTGADRVVEVDAETDEIVWTYDGSGSGAKLQWPRDADRLPNGNTLITDSRNNRVIEIDGNGSVVWRYSLAQEGGIIYEADRVSHPANETYIPEEYAAVPAGRTLESRTKSNPIGAVGAVVGSWAGFVFPYWIGPLELLVGLGGLVGLVGLGWEGWRARG
jgi:hypothetical protein